MQASVYIVHHVRAEAGRADDVRMIGVYSSKDAAKNAIARARMQPGFRRYPNGFKIAKHALDKDQLTEGFGTGAQPTGPPR